MLLQTRIQLLKTQACIVMLGIKGERTMFKGLIAIFFVVTLGGNIYADQTSTPEVRPSPITPNEAIKELSKFVDKMTDEGVFSGTVLLAKDGKVLYAAARGMASKRFNVPNNLQTKFSLASMNKMFTATAILQLAEKNKISLTDKLSQYLDESWLPKEISSKIEIQHLLTHASGLSSYFTDRFFESSKSQFVNLADFKPFIVTDTLKFEPGTDYKYSNNGMLLLGAVIESVTDEDYFEFIRRNIYLPANMINSDCYRMDEPVPNLAIGYNASPERQTGWINNFYWKPLRGGPAGGCYSTVEDLHNFATTLTSYKFLNRENTASLYSPKHEFHQKPYGYGFKISGTPGNRIVGHRGGFVGISSNLDIFLDAGYVSVVLSNHGGGSIPIYEKIRELIKKMDPRGSQVTAGAE